MLSTFFELTGIALIVAAAALVYVPLAMCLGGVVLVLVGFSLSRDEGTPTS